MQGVQADCPSRRARRRGGAKGRGERKGRRSENETLRTACCRSRGADAEAAAAKMLAPVPVITNPTRTIGQSVSRNIYESLFAPTCGPLDSPVISGSAGGF